MIELYIDTSSNERTVIGLTFEGKKVEKIVEKKVVSSQILLPLIDEILCESGFTAHMITSIKVNTGPGSFTGLRVGVTVANTLSWMLNIPVNGKKNNIIEPKYE